MLNRGVPTISIPSKIFPLSGLLCFLITISLCVFFNRLYDHDIGGIPWPYLSDTGKYPPESAIFAFGLTLTCVLICVVVILNYGLVKREITINGSIIQDLNKLGESNGMEGWLRNRISMFLGVMASPFLGLLAVFDTDRTPGLHLLFVLGFFPFMLAYVFTNTSVYRILLDHKRRRHHKVNKHVLALLEKSVKAKQIISVFLAIFVTLYLPVGMYLVTDWYTYSNDKVIHTFRAVTQHLSVLCLVFYFGSFWFDFGTLRMTVVQTDDVDNQYSKKEQ
jgi:hypothetical protein